jgi:hypothetical protein
MSGAVKRYNLRSAAPASNESGTEDEDGKPRKTSKALPEEMMNIRVACLLAKLPRCPEPFDLQNLAVALDPTWWPIFWEDRNLTGTDMDSVLGRIGDGGKLKQQYLLDTTRALQDHMSLKGSLNKDITERLAHLASLHCQLARHWVKLDPDNWSLAVFLQDFSELVEFGRKEGKEIVATVIKHVKGRKAEESFRSALAIDSAVLPSYLTTGVEAAVKAKRKQDTASDGSSDDGHTHGRYQPRNKGRRNQPATNTNTNEIVYEEDKHSKRRSRSGVWWVFDKASNKRLGVMKK